MKSVLPNTKGEWASGTQAAPGGARESAFAAAVLLCPALLFWHLHGTWNPDADYAYGWVVPLLAAFLCKSRWDDRPEPSAPVGTAVFVAIALALLTLPALWLQEAAPERGICQWSLAIVSVGTSLALIAFSGGFAWLRWFGFPFGFVLTAVPWPHLLEMFTTEYLMRATASVTVEILCLVGIPCARSGNLVQIEAGVIDIDEACGGIRSLQAMVMISLFLGELFRLTPVKRLLLLVLGLAATLLANVVRTVNLSWIGFNRGLPALDAFHDIAGMAVLVCSLAGTLAAAFLLRPARTEAPPAACEKSGEGKGGFTPRFPWKLGCALLIWFAVTEGSVEAWYRFHEPKWQGWSWAVRWPEHREAFKWTRVPSHSQRILRCDELKAATWKEPDGSEWSLYSIRWNPGNVAAEPAKVHRPDVCLNAEGATMERDMGTQIVPVGRMNIPFHTYTFGLSGKTLHIFFCLYEEGSGAGAVTATPQFEGTGMFERAIEGRRNIALQTVEVAISGCPSAKEAHEAFHARVGELIEMR